MSSTFLHALHAVYSIFPTTLGNFIIFIALILQTNWDVKKLTCWRSYHQLVGLGGIQSHTFWLQNPHITTRPHCLPGLAWSGSGFSGFIAGVDLLSARLLLLAYFPAKCQHQPTPFIFCSFLMPGVDSYCITNWPAWASFPACPCLLYYIAQPENAALTAGLENWKA